MKKDKKKTRFVVMESENINMVDTTYVIEDSETGVQYFAFKSGYGMGLTPLLNSDGKPVINGK